MRKQSELKKQISNSRKTTPPLISSQSASSAESAPVPQVDQNALLENTEDDLQRTSDGKTFLLKNAEHNALLQLDKSYNALLKLSAARLDNKLSNSRVIGVAKELRELIKVMSVYA